MTPATLSGVHRAADVPTAGSPGALDRFVLDGDQSGGALAVVEHVLAPRVLAAPLHRHEREDEFSYVLSGRLAVWEEGRVVTAEPGDLVRKPRGRWHTFWNGGDGKLRVLELIAPAGLEQLFRRLGEPGGEYGPETLPTLAAAYGCAVDFPATEAVMGEYGLRFAD